MRSNINHAFIVGLSATAERGLSFWLEKEHMEGKEQFPLASMESSVKQFGMIEHQSRINSPELREKKPAVHYLGVSQSD